MSESAAVTVVTDTTFESEVMASPLAVLVDFHAEWCQPCKQLSPLVSALAERHVGALKVVSVDVDQNPGLAQAFRVQSIPMLVVIHGGQLVGHHMGMLSAEELDKLVQPFVDQSAVGGGTGGAVPVTQTSTKELAQMIQSGSVVVADGRPKASFDRFRIPSAVHADPDTLGEFVSPRPGVPLVIYGRDLNESREIAEKLNTSSSGHGAPSIGYLEGGFLFWESDGFEVERGNS